MKNRVVKALVLITCLMTQISFGALWRGSDEVREGNTRIWNGLLQILPNIIRALNIPLLVIPTMEAADIENYVEFLANGLGIQDDFIKDLAYFGNQTNLGELNAAFTSFNDQANRLGNDKLLVLFLGIDAGLLSSGNSKGDRFINLPGLNYLLSNPKVKLILVYEGPIDDLDDRISSRVKEPMLLPAIPDVRGPWD